MRQHRAERDVRLAVGRELGPELRDRVVGVEIPALDQQVGADRGRALRGGEDERRRVLAPAPAARDVRHPAPDVDDGTPVDVEAAGRTDIAVSFEVGAPPRPRRPRTPARRVLSITGGVYGGAPVGSGRGRAVLRRDPGLPEERRGLRQGRRHAARRRARPRRPPRRRRPRRRQHVRVRRGGPAGVDRRRPRARRREATGCPARGHRVHGRALRRRARGGAARGRRGGRLRRRGRARRTSCSGAASRPASGTCSSCPGRRPDALGVREGRRGLRPRLRVLRHPVVPGQAALPRRIDSIEAEVRALVRRRRRPRSCSSPRTSPGTDATSASPARSHRCCAGSTSSRRAGSQRVRLLYLYPSEVTDPLVATMLELADRRPVLRPLAAARGARVCCAA